MVRNNAVVPKRLAHDRLDPLGAIAALAAPLRRAIYEFVLSRDEPIERDEAATAVRSGLPVATFHLERLVAAGLLEVAGPTAEPRGRGRPPKRYQTRRLSPEFSLPPRNYGLFGKILRRAARGRPSGRDPRLHAAAREIGREIGRDVRPTGRRRSVSALLRALSELAYEPKLDGMAIRLRSCPLAALSNEAPDQVCAANLAFLDGFIQSVDGRSLAAVPDPTPRPGACCVLIRLQRT